MTQTQKNEKRTVQGLPNSQKIILDVCCGGRMFWFDKKNPDTLFLDNRIMPPKKMTNGATLEVAPDRVMDFRKLDLLDNHFALVVFDPPHILKRGGKNSWMKDKYGELDKNTWREDLRKGFSECFRVLKPEGVLIFKWSEFDISLKEILALTPVKPLFGHRSGKAQKTHWICFMKITNQ
jgi:SAM-dependent methyltransferase